jgi:hypothetical protein
VTIPLTTQPKRHTDGPRELQIQRAWRERNHHRLMAEAAAGWPPWRGVLRRLALRLERWLQRDESELDWSSDGAGKMGDG